jgi:hypothetical protein
MKRGFVLFFVFLFAVSVSAQIVDFEIVSSKTYDNNTSTTYLTLVGDFDKTLCDEITSDLESYPEIQKFSFYDNTDLMRCMFTADLAFDAEKIVQLINDMVVSGNNSNSLSFANIWKNQNGYEIFFQIDEIVSDLQRRQIEEVLMKDSRIMNAVVNMDDCKIISTELLSPLYIQDILNKFGIIIRQSSIK